MLLLTEVIVAIIITFTLIVVSLVIITRLVFNLIYRESIFCVITDCSFAFRPDLIDIFAYLCVYDLQYLYKNSQAQRYLERSTADKKTLMTDRFIGIPCK